MEINMRNSISFMEQLAQHLLANGADLSKTVIQTDNGSEFIGSWNAKKDSAFTEKVESYSMTHRTIPPKAHTWQADVETSHNLIEDEFYTIEAGITMNSLYTITMLGYIPKRISSSAS
jgi:hypothetical protein